MNFEDNNIIFNALRESEKEVKVSREVPPGYTKICLSTKGKVGAPKEFHIRNFKIKDIVALSLTDGEDTTIKLIDILNDMIWEDDVDVATWHENEVQELMVYILITYYKSILTDIAFPFNDEDKEFLLKNREDGESIVKSLESGEYIPRIDINIPEVVETYDLDDNFKSEITITNKRTGFHVTFGYIKFGDQIVIKKWMNEIFRNEEIKFSVIQKQIEYNNNILNNLKENPDSINNFIVIDKEQYEEYKEYSSKRLQTIAEAVKIISILDYNGTDVRNMPLGEKYELLSDDARIDYNMIAKLNSRQQKMPFGIKPEIRMNNPLTGGVVSRPFSFQLSYLLQAMQLQGNDDYDDGYDDED